MCVLIPVYNEANTIGSIARAIRADGIDVVVVNDGSTDNSEAVANENGAVVMRHDIKSGKGSSLRMGFAHILKQGYGAVITMDGDGQHDVGDIHRFLEFARTHRPAIIVGNRMTDPKGMPWVRYLTNRFMSLLISLACRQGIPDTQCGYRYLDCRLLREISLRCDDFEIETEMLMKAAKKGFPVYSVPIRTIYRDEESKINPLKDTLRFIVYFLKEVASPASGEKKP
jgi:glycosyltransferase involved in cell wall biosynthesis